MNGVYSADDLFKRSIFASIANFGGKDGKSMKADQQSLESFERGFRSQQEIYREIVCECMQLEEKSFPLQNCETDGNDSYTSQISTSSTNLNQNMTNGIPSIEDIVKLVLGAIRDKGIDVLKSLPKETPEELQRKKRIKNNEAAARYRRRQKEMKYDVRSEMINLNTENEQMRNEIKRLRNEIESLKQRLSRCLGR